MKRHFYQGVIVVLLCFFIFFFTESHQNYMDLLECNDDLVSLVDEQRNHCDILVATWEDRYEKLLSYYGKLLIEKDKLERQELATYYFTEEEVYLIAQCVEAEMGMYEQSQKWGTKVILNRLHSNKFPDSVEEVIYQKVNGVPQFSVAYNGTIDREVQPETLANVYSVIVHGSDLPEYVCYFYSAKVVENWVNELPVYDTVDGTVFAYKDKEDY